MTKQERNNIDINNPLRGFETQDIVFERRLLQTIGLSGDYSIAIPTTFKNEVVYRMRQLGLGRSLPEIRTYCSSFTGQRFYIPEHFACFITPEDTLENRIATLAEAELLSQNPQLQTVLNEVFILATTMNNAQEAETKRNFLSASQRVIPYSCYVCGFPYVVIDNIAAFYPNIKSTKLKYFAGISPATDAFVPSVGDRHRVNAAKNGYTHWIVK